MEKLFSFLQFKFNQKIFEIFCIKIFYTLLFSFLVIIETRKFFIIFLLSFFFYVLALHLLSFYLSFF